jgi:regulator of sirC expression with transglutaminase-like and TPR domain
MYPSQKRVLAPVLVAPVLAALIVAAHACQARAGELRAKEIYQHTLRSAAWVRTDEGSGSGWVLDRANRLLVTNHHVVGNNDAVRVYFPVVRDGRVLAEKAEYLDKVKPVVGRVLDSDPGRDLAVVQLESLPEGVTGLPLAEEGAGPGDTLHCLGNPGASGALWVYSSGTVRQVYRKEMRYSDGQTVNARVIETQAPINPGDSGGPVVNGRGELVGVNAALRGGAVLFAFCIDVSEVREYTALVKRLMNPRSAGEFTERGERAQGRGRTARALADFGAALRLNPRHGPAYQRRGLVFAEWGDDVKALADLNRAVELDPGEVEPFLARGLVVARNGGDAEADFTRVLHLDGRNAVALYQRGLARERKGDSRGAVADFDALLRLAPGNARALKARARAHSAGGAYDKALEDYAAVLEKNPEDAEAHRLRALVYSRKGEYERAEADVRAAARLVAAK